MIKLCVKEIVALANSSGGYLLLGVEDNKEITGCKNYDLQNIIESIYDRTMPNLFTKAEVVESQGKDVIVITVDKSNRLCGTSSGEYYKRLGKNSKPYTPDRMKETFDEENDYSSRVIRQSCVDDINLLEVYKLKEKLKARDLQSTLVDLDDLSFLKDLSLLVETEEGLKLNVAGLLFVGKESAIQRFLPQAECIYLHYSDNNKEEYDNRLDLKMLMVGFGTFLNNGDECEKSICQAIQAGYRLIDTAEAYDNGKEVGKGIQLSGIDRKKFLDNKSMVY